MKEGSKPNLQMGGSQWRMIERRYKMRDTNDENLKPEHRQSPAKVEGESGFDGQGCLGLEMRYNGTDSLERAARGYGAPVLCRPAKRGMAMSQPGATWLKRDGHRVRKFSAWK